MSNKKEFTLHDSVLGHMSNMTEFTLHECCQLPFVQYFFTLQEFLCATTVHFSLTSNGMFYSNALILILSKFKMKPKFKYYLYVPKNIKYHTLHFRFIQYRVLDCSQTKQFKYRVLNCSQAKQFKYRVLNCSQANNSNIEF